MLKPKEFPVDENGNVVKPGTIVRLKAAWSDGHKWLCQDAEFFTDNPNEAGQWVAEGDDWWEYCDDLVIVPAQSPPTESSQLELINEGGIS